MQTDWPARRETQIRTAPFPLAVPTLNAFENEPEPSEVAERVRRFWCGNQTVICTVAFAAVVPRTCWLLPGFTCLWARRAVTVGR